MTVHQPPPRWGPNVMVHSCCCSLQENGLNHKNTQRGKGGEEVKEGLDLLVSKSPPTCSGNISAGVYSRYAEKLELLTAPKLHELEKTHLFSLNPLFYDSVLFLIRHLDGLRFGGGFSTLENSVKSGAPKEKKKTHQWQPPQIFLPWQSRDWRCGWHGDGARPSAIAEADWPEQCRARSPALSPCLRAPQDGVARHQIGPLDVSKRKHRGTTKA